MNLAVNKGLVGVGRRVETGETRARIKSVPLRHRVRVLVDRPGVEPTSEGRLTRSARQEHSFCPPARHREFQIALSVSAVLPGSEPKPREALGAGLRFEQARGMRDREACALDSDPIFGFAPQRMNSREQEKPVARGELRVYYARFGDGFIGDGRCETRLLQIAGMGRGFACKSRRSCVLLRFQEAKTEKKNCIPAPHTQTETI